MDIVYPHTAHLRQNTLLVVHPLKRGSAAIENEYDVIALRLIERIELINGRPAAKQRKKGR